MAKKEQGKVGSKKSVVGGGAQKVSAKKTEKTGIQTSSTPDEFRAKYADVLQKTGLTGKEAVIFGVLLERGELGAGEIISYTNLKRGDAYNHIYSLQRKGLVAERSVRGRMKFSVEHPSNIEDYIENRANRLKEAQKELRAVLPGIISTYNLSYHKPGVKVFEGTEGSDLMVRDSLEANTEIYSYIDPRAVDRYMPATNKRYIKERIRRGLKKKIIVSDTTQNRERYRKRDDQLTEVRFINYRLPDFASNMQIYDNKVTFHTLRPESMMGVIIEDPLIAKMQRALFEYVWDTAKK